MEPNKKKKRKKNPVFRNHANRRSRGLLPYAQRRSGARYQKGKGLEKNQKLIPINRINRKLKWLGKNAADGREWASYSVDSNW